MTWAFIEVTCSVLYKEFNRLNQTLENIIKRPEEMNQMLESLRTKHEKLCVCMDNLDTIISMQLGISLFCGMFSACLILYNVANSSSAMELGFNAVFTTGQLVSLLLATVLPAVINDVVRIY